MNVMSEIGKDLEADRRRIEQKCILHGKIYSLEFVIDNCQKGIELAKKKLKEIDELDKQLKLPIQ